MSASELTFAEKDRMAMRDKTSTIEERWMLIRSKINQFYFEFNGELIVRFRDGVPVEIEPRPRIQLGK